MADIETEGGCLCGAVRYRVTGEAVSSNICHCQSCRRASGAPNVAWFTVRTAQFLLTAGAVAVFHSSQPVKRTFCAQCGTPLTYEHLDAAGYVDVTTASLDDPNVFHPAREIWLSHKLPWVAVDPRRSHHQQDSKR